MTPRIVRVLLTAAAVAVPSLALGQAKMYFTGNGNGPDTVRRANLDGTNVEVLVANQGGPQALSVDPTGGKMYWTDGPAVKAADLDGSNAVTLVPGLGSPRGIAVDGTGGKVYWTDLINKKVQRANLDGTGIQDLVTTGLNAPTPVALATQLGKVYWADVNNDVIQRSNLDGTNLETVLNEDGWGVAVDEVNGFLYWTATSSIRRSSLTGAGAVNIVTGLSWARGIAIDAAGGKIYWSDVVTQKIQRANLDGTNVEDLITTGLDTILSISLDLGGCPSPTLTYGQGCAGSGGFVPELAADPCAVIGGQFTISLNQGLGGSNALLFLGVAQASVPIGGGCSFLVSPVLPPILTLPLGGAGAGGGSVMLPLIIPASAPSGAVATLQAFVVDNGVARGYSNSNGLQITIQ